MAFRLDTGAPSFVLKDKYSAWMHTRAIGNSCINATALGARMSRANASVQNMTDYLMNMTGAMETVTLGDNDRNRTDYCFAECDQIVRKLHHLFYFKRRETAYEQCKPAKTYR